jgi:predicted flap endonuclease-1-like 5' DNA nuclease
MAAEKAPVSRASATRTLAAVMAAEKMYSTELRRMTGLAAVMAAEKDRLGIHHCGI